MASVARQSTTPLLLEDGFRTFFLLAPLAAVLLMAAWIAMWRGVMPMPTGISPTLWHAHEMVFGFVGAAFAGFLFTAVPNWTRRAPLRGWPIALLALLWLSGRVVMYMPGSISPGLVMVVDNAFPAALLILIAREIALAGNRRNLLVVATLLVWAGANVGFHLGTFSEQPGLARSAMLLGVQTVALMIVVIGGRVIPAFTANWLRARSSPAEPAIRPALERLSVPLTAVTGLLLVLAPQSLATAGAALATALLHGIRLSGWQSFRVCGEPLLLVLHLGYAWIVCGYLFLGISIIWPQVLASVGVHALTTGAFGTMILAIMSRASLGHTGRALTAPAAVVGAYALVSLAAITRILAAWFPHLHAELLTASGTLWIVAFAVFVVVYWPILTNPPKAPA